MRIVSLCFPVVCVALHHDIFDEGGSGSECDILDFLDSAEPQLELRVLESRWSHAAHCAGFESAVFVTTGWGLSARG